MYSIKNLKMIVGTAKTSHMLLLFTSIVLIGIGIYGTIVSKEYGCDEGINMKLYKDSLGNFIKDFSISNDCLTSLEKSNPRAPPDEIIQKCGSSLSPFAKCIASKVGSSPENNQSTINKLDRCLNDNGKGYLRCMEGGLFGLSIVSIVIGVLMLLLSGYLLFM